VERSRNYFAVGTQQCTLCIVVAELHVPANHTKCRVLHNNSFMVNLRQQ